jgi:hypothetical protein
MPKLRFRNDRLFLMMPKFLPTYPGCSFVVAMRRMHTCVVLFVLLVLGLSPALPAEDLPGTAYDESETQPYESSPSISNLMAETAFVSQTALSEIQIVRNALRLQTATPFLPSVRPIARADADRFTGARSLLAQVCTLLF